MLILNRLIKSLILLTITLIVLTGCRNDAAIKQQLQDNYDKKNRSGNQAFCLQLGDRVDFPYTTKNVPIVSYESNQSQFMRYRWNLALNKRLSIFSRLGLFEQELVTPAEQAPLGEAIYRYTLTDEGEKYLVLWADMTTLCFGRRVIVDILSDRKDKDNWGSTVTTINFSYQVEGMPEWIKDPEINNIYHFDGFGLNTDGEISTGMLFFKDSAKGLRISGGPSGMWIF